MAAKVSKLQEQFKLDAPKEKHKEGLSSDIFFGVSIYVNGYTGNVLCEVLLRTRVQNYIGYVTLTFGTKIYPLREHREKTYFV